MSGHSKWASIKHKKGKEDARRGKIFTKLIRELTVAARAGGGDPNGNPRLRQAILDAKAENMPRDNIERAIKRGTGGLEGVNYEQVTYEGYGPRGVALLVEVLTDNKNRASADLRRIFSKGGGNLGESGCVGWMFQRKGIFIFDKAAVSEDELIETVLEAGGDDVIDAGDTHEVHIDPAKFEDMKNRFDSKGWKYLHSEITMVPQNTVKVTGEQAEKVFALVDTLEDSDDVQHVYGNYDIDESIPKAG